MLAVLLALCPSGAPGGTAASSALALDYRLPPRYGLDANHDGLVDSVTTPAQVSPPRWTALVAVRWPGGGPCLGTYRWSIGGRPASLVQQRNPTTGLRTCTFAYSGFTQLDRPYRLGVTASGAMWAVVVGGGSAILGEIWSEAEHVGLVSLLLSAVILFGVSRVTRTGPG